MRNGSRPARQVVILGAGTGGTMTANLLARELRRDLRAGRVRIVVVGESGEHVFQPANLDVAFKGASPERFVHAQLPLLRRGVEFVPDAARRVETQRNVVVLTNGRELVYDALVLATGAHADLDLIPGLRGGSLNFHTGPFNAKRIWDALSTFDRGRLVVAIAGVPYKCPPSPNEAVFLLDDLFRARGQRGDVEIRLVTPYPRAYPAAPIAGVVEPRLDSRGIDVTTLFNLDSVDADRKVVTSLEGEEVAYDLLITIPPHVGAKVIRESGLGDEEGWIPTDKETMRVKGRDNVWALGDATDIPISKSGVVAHLQADIVAKNIAAQLEGRPVELAFEGRINCPMEVGSHEALFVSATYAKAPEPQTPNVVRYAMKRTFGRMYWTVLKGRLEWVFATYFGKTSHPR